jgi:enoyl-[acyl-carrier protein] reductase II
MSLEILGEHLAKMRGLDRPWGVNLPLSHPRVEEQLELCLERGVKVVFTSAGSPARFTERLKRAGVTVAHVVPSTALARKVEAAGCDAVVAEGIEAGGHNGFDQITSVNLWPAVAAAVSIPVIAAGGVVDGRGMAAALALGAAGVQVGSRFAVTHEASCHPTYKQAVVQAGEADARLYLSGVMPTRALVNPYLERVRQAEGRGAGKDELLALRGTGRARRGIFEGDRLEGELEVGQAAGRIGEVRGAAQVVEQMVAQYRETLDQLRAVDAGRPGGSLH